MRTFGTIAVILLFTAQPVFAQPMSGGYTVGGTLPDFVTLQEAANAVKLNGVSGPVFINIRPGTYTRDGGASTLFVLDSTIAGVSPVNRITFQPDAVSGGDVDNVILQADFTSSSTRVLVDVRADYISLRSLTFKDADSMDTPVGNFISAGIDNSNTFIEGLEVDGCKFIGTPYFAFGGQFGTDIGIGSGQTLASASFTHNRFHRICRGVTTANDNNRAGTIIVEDNEFYQGYLNSTGSGNQIGSAIELACTHASVRRNIIDLAGGRGAKSGIEVIFAASAVIERNLIKNRVPIGGPFDGFTGISVRNSSAVDSIVVANNAIVANRAWVHTYCMQIETPNTKVLHNTIVDAALGGGDNIALTLTGANCTVLNNIILGLSDAVFVAFDQGNAGSAANLVSDHNVIFVREGSGASGLVRRNGTMFASLTGYQAGTGLDTNSVSKTIVFSDGFHLDSCQAQDPDLNAIPVPGITVDYDGARRDSVTSFKGADESVRIPYDMFGDGFRTGVSGVPFSLAAGDFFDNDSDADIAIPDYENRQIQLFRNLGPSRSFVQSGTLSTIVRPGVIKLTDYDEDGSLDLIVGGDTSAVEVFWGDGAGTFSSRTIVGTYGRVRSIERGPFTTTIVITEDNGFLPTSSFLGVIMNFRPGPRDLCHDAQRVISQDSIPLFAPEIDTMHASMTALVTGDLGGDQTWEIAALTIGPLPTELFVFKDIGFLFTFPGGPPCGNLHNFVATHREYQFGTASYLGFASSIVIKDFDNDGDNDLLTTSASENSCILVRNQGDFTFSADAIATTQTRAIVALDYEQDGDFDFVAANRTLYDHGITIFLNDGLGNFTAKPNCFFPFASGFPNGMVASDFDLDGRTDIAIASSFDSLFVLYNLGGFNGTTGVEENPRQQVPTAISLHQNYPNPFNPSTHIEYTLPARSHVALRIYNILGQEVALIVDEEKAGGHHSVEWNGRSMAGSTVSSGVYFYRVEVRQNGAERLFVATKKMIVIR